ncbi:DUF6924 domain-containing protein [Streptomyces sp. NPDC018057]|uniref:DUF6924 domain-containing protein n=1 Tax=unclassified Streptomyces TaxID=2593676 RepID=UPI0037BA4E23
MTRPLPDTSAHGDLAAVVIRTDYEDSAAWQAVRAALDAPDEFGEPESWIVDDPAWAGAGVDEVLAAVAADEQLNETVTVVFLADTTTMRSPLQPLLAVTTFTREDCEDDEEYTALTEYGRAFRTEPAGVHAISANLELANMGFQNFSAGAAAAPQQVFRADWRTAD